MQYQQHEQDGVTVLEFSGRVDLSTSSGFRQQILKLINDDHHLLVDLSHVTYIDSSGMASLIEAPQAARDKSLRFSLTGITDSVMNVFKLMRLDQVLPLHNKSDNA